MPGLLVFPLVGVALAVLVRGRTDTLAWVVRLAAYTYATFYTALDVINGIAAGYVTHAMGPGVPRSDEIRAMFAIGRPIGDVGEWALLATCLAIAVDQLTRHRLPALPALALLPGAWLVRSDHIFSPLGVLGMTIIGLTTGYLGPGWARPQRGHRKFVSGSAQPHGVPGRHRRVDTHHTPLTLGSTRMEIVAATDPALVLTGDFDVRSTGRSARRSTTSWPPTTTSWWTSPTSTPST